MWTHHFIVDGLGVSCLVVGGIVGEELVLPARVQHLHRAALRAHLHHLPTDPASYGARASTTTIPVLHFFTHLLVLTRFWWQRAFGRCFLTCAEKLN